MLYRFRIAFTLESAEPIRVRGPLFLRCPFNEHIGATWTIWAGAHCSKVLRSEDQFHCGISNASTTNICASTSRISCSIELAEEVDPCKSWYTLCRTVTDAFMAASGDSKVKLGSQALTISSLPSCLLYSFAMRSMEYSTSPSRISCLSKTPSKNSSASGPKAWLYLRKT